MSGHNAGLSLPLGDRDDAPSPALNASDTVVERKPAASAVEKLAQTRAALMQRIDRKKRRHETIWDDLGRLKLATLQELQAELANPRPAKHRRRRAA